MTGSAARFTTVRWVDKNEAAAMTDHHPRTITDRARFGTEWEPGYIPGVKRGGRRTAKWLFPVEAVEAYHIADLRTLASIAKRLPKPAPAATRTDPSGRQAKKKAAA